MQAASVPPDEPARLKAVRRYEKLLRAAHDAGEFDDCAKLAAQLCGTPISLVTVVGEDTQWFLSAVGLDVEETPRDVSFCAHTILGADLFEVRDTHTDERFHDNPLVTGDPGVRFYAGAPLVTPSGHRLGTVCVIDREPRQLTLEQREALARLATQVGKLMELLTVTKELETERNRLEQVMDAAAVALWSFDVEEDLFTANDAFYSLCGTTAEREGGYQMTLASYTRDFVHPDDLPLIERERALLDSAPSDSVSRLEHRIVRRDGEVRHVLGYYRLSKDAAGRMTGASGSIQDITDRKRAEERVHELNTRLEEVLESRTESLAREQGLNQLMLESLGAGVAACDADGRLILFNQAAREWHGTDPTDIPPEEWAAHYDLYEGDGVTPLAEERIPLVRALSGETISNIEMAIAREGIAPRDLLVNGGPLDDKDGSRLGAVVVMHDVTELKRADEMLRVKHRQLVQAESSGEVGSFEFDLVSGSLVWTEGLHRIYGVDPETFSPGYEDFISRLHPDDRDRVAATISRAIEGTEEFDFEERIIRPGGEERVLHTRGRVAVGEEDGPGRVVGLCQDITDRVERDRLMRMALATLDATPDSATVFDRESLRFEYVNQGAIRQLGYTEEELLAMTPLDVKPEFDESSFRELLHSISESDSAVRQFTTVHRTKEGDDVPVEIVLQYVKVPSAAPRFIPLCQRT